MQNTDLWTALVTPMKRGGSIDFEDLNFLVKKQEQAGNGILLIGSTGEGLALDSDEKLAIVRHVAKLKPEVPVMAGVGGYNLKNQINWIKTCNGFGIDSFLLVTPLYSKPGIKGQIEWFTLLMDVADKPCMLYNIPSRTGTNLHVDVLKNVKNHGRFWAVKEASGRIEDFEQFRSQCPDVPLYSGDDGLLPYFAVAGCHGLVSVSANVWPAATKLYTRLCLKKETDTIFPVWQQAVKAMFSAPNPVPAKVLLAHKKWIKTDVLRAPLTTKEVFNIEPLLHADSEILEWYNKNK